MTSSTKHVAPPSSEGGTCIETAEFLRLRYFYGRMLSAEDFQTEQNFFREKLKLHNRCLHGYGVVCGLRVELLPMPKECDDKEQEVENELKQKLQDLIQKKQSQVAATAAGTPSAPATTPATASPLPVAPTLTDGKEQDAAAKDLQPAAAGGAPPAKNDAPSDSLDAEIEKVRRAIEKLRKDHCREEPRTRIQIDCGLALDCQGNELVLRKPIPVDLLRLLSPQESEQVKHSLRSVYVSVCYCENEVNPMRPVLPEACGAAIDSAFGKVQECVRVSVTLNRPEHDHRCETCCEPCKNPCVYLARIDCFVPGHPLQPHQIHNEVQRPISQYDPTAIAGISWRHGHTYTQEEAQDLLGTEDQDGSKQRGLEIRFTRPVRASTIHRGVMDVWVIEGGRGKSGNIYNKSGELEFEPDEGYVDRIWYRDTSGETLEPEDRVLISLRTDFILDHCCRSVDGENTGGRVPLLPEHHRHHDERHEEKEHEGEHHAHEHHARECWEAPGRPGPWRSGNRIPGGTFESWFYIRGEDKERRKAK
jgi:hypothetical protein